MPSHTRTRARFVAGRLAGAGLIVVFTAVTSGCDQSSPLTPTPGPTPGPPPGPTGPASTGPIAFVSNRDGRQHSVIYLANADGSGVTRLVDGLSVGWSPDGRTLGFSRFDGVYVINADGTGLRRIWTAAPSRYAQGAPAWSPDGARIAFTESGSADTGIHVMRSDGSDVSRLVSHGPGCGDFCRGGDRGVGFPAWSPDGRRIAFEVFNYDYPSGIHVMNSDGSDPRALTDSVEHASSPSWSPDGGTIAFAQWGAIGIINADGSGRRVFLQVPDVQSPRWAPDGSIVFSGVNSAGSRRIFIATGSGSPRQVVPDAAAPANTIYGDWGAVWAR